MAELVSVTGIHAPGPHEHSLCGFAPEAFESGDADDPVIFAKDGEAVTCPMCRHFINFVKSNFKRYRYDPSRND